MASSSRLVEFIGLFCIYKRDYILQKRLVILRNLLIVATPYEHIQRWNNVDLFIFGIFIY